MFEIAAKIAGIYRVRTAPGPDWVELSNYLADGFARTPGTSGITR
jgi:hypothetical protein